ncbi:MAG: triose-phosphate isomerase [Clostridia bacterium]|nr:triose-phosphate isomerase [Clostridia bacterium]
MNKQLRCPVIAGNWKMNKTPAQAKELLDAMLPLVADAPCKVVVCTPFVDLPVALAACAGINVEVGAQNMHFAESGAFTGEISASMLTEMGVSYVIIGHSERRQYFAETDETVNKKVLAALQAGLKPIVCVGESLQQRENGETDALVSSQVRAALAGVSADRLQDVIIAYEPIWAIGTGKTATSAQANETCGVIRAAVADLYGQDAADRLVIQYGGSMNAGNAAELLAQPHVDGGLIGGASLKAPDFSAIVHAAE